MTRERRDRSTERSSRQAADQPPRHAADQPSRRATDQPPRAAADQQRRTAADQPRQAAPDQPRQGPPDQQRRGPPQRRQEPQQWPVQQPMQQPAPQQYAASTQLQQGSQPMQPTQGSQPVPAPAGPAAPQPSETAPIPAIDVFETEESVTVLVDLPGCDEDDIRIRAENDQLSFAAERRDDVAEAATAVQRERPRTFQRTVAIPIEADVEGASARYDAGVCTVRFPKTDRRRQREIGFQ